VQPAVWWAATTPAEAGVRLACATPGPRRRDCATGPQEDTSHDQGAPEGHTQLVSASEPRGVVERG